MGTNYSQRIADRAGYTIRLYSLKKDIIDQPVQMNYENAILSNVGVWSCKQASISLELRGNHRTSAHRHFDSCGKGISVLARSNPTDTRWIMDKALSSNHKNWDGSSRLIPEVRIKKLMVAEHERL